MTIPRPPKRLKTSIYQKLDKVSSLQQIVEQIELEQQLVMQGTALEEDDGSEPYGRCSERISEARADEDAKTALPQCLCASTLTRTRLIFNHADCFHIMGGRCVACPNINQEEIGLDERCRSSTDMSMAGRARSRIRAMGKKEEDYSQCLRHCCCCCLICVYHSLLPLDVRFKSVEFSVHRQFGTVYHFDCVSVKDNFELVFEAVLLLSAKYEVICSVRVPRKAGGASWECMGGLDPSSIGVVMIRGGVPQACGFCDLQEHLRNKIKEVSSSVEVM
ncbi:hypothetical protein NDU88_006706 [Pleurodeles waltl]|uniref:Uncharacterized protein n=1 Tax=Pleurodeles waltl TaxID=8319 RepID=A0AAV7ULU0_PLEWA|nr:hypothetical protein NDU88_006706 [Pleurodeles waltl]